MKTNVVEAVKFCFTGKLISQISISVDEAEKRVEKALEKAIPLVLESLMLRAERAGGPSALLAMACEAHAADLLHHLPHLSTTPWYATGAGLMQGLSGDGYESLINRIAIVSGIRPAAGEELLLVAAAAVLSVLGKYATENELTPTEFVSWFKAQKLEVAMALFPDMNRQPDALADSLEGAHHLSAIRQSAPVAQRASVSAEHGTWTPVGGGSIFTPQSETHSPAAPAAPNTTGFRWQWSLLLLFAVCLGYYFGHERLTTIPGTVAAFADTPGTTTPPAVLTTSATGDAAASTPLGTYDRDRDMYIYDTGQPIVLTLANGSSQKVGANSTENRLYTFLSDPSFQVDSVNRTKGWISFDRVYFDAGKATLTPESEQQLHNIAEVLKTFPEAKVKLGGYTDNTGLDAKNLVLSEERAKTAALALVKKGIPFHRLQFKGYGAKYFVAANETPEGRALNRRISIRVVKK